MPYNSAVFGTPQLPESNKFVEITNDSRFPPTLEKLPGIGNILWQIIAPMVLIFLQVLHLKALSSWQDMQHPWAQLIQEHL